MTPARRRLLEAAANGKVRASDPHKYLEIQRAWHQGLLERGQDGDGAWTWTLTNKGRETLHAAELAEQRQEQR